MRKSSGLYILIIIAILVMPACRKDKILGEYHIPEELKASNPYVGNETIIYRIDSFDTLQFSVKRTDQIVEKYTDPPYVYYLCEEDLTSLINNSYSLFLSMGAYYSDPTPEEILFTFEYLTEGYSFSAWFYVMENNNETMLDSLFVNDSWVYNIYSDTMRYFTHEGPFPYEDHDYPTRSYFSKEYGIVKIDFSNGSTWELEDIIR